MSFVLLLKIINQVKSIIMKKLLQSLVIIFFFSCNDSEISQKDLATIDTYVLLHNTSYGLKYELDSLEARKNLLISTIGMGEEKSEKYVDSVLNERYNKKDYYSPRTDPRLTREKLIEFCKGKKFGPVEFAKKLVPDKK